MEQVPSSSTNNAYEELGHSAVEVGSHEIAESLESGESNAASEELGHSAVEASSNDIVDGLQSGESIPDTLVENGVARTRQAESARDENTTIVSELAVTELELAVTDLSASTAVPPKKSRSCFSSMFRSFYGNGSEDPAPATHECMDDACCVCFVDFGDDPSTARAQLSCSHPVCKECATRICSHAQIQGAVDAPCPLCRRSMSEIGTVLKKERQARAVERRRRRVRLTQFQWWQLSMMMLATSLAVIFLVRAGWNVAAACVGAFLALQVYIPAKQALQQSSLCAAGTNS